MPPGKISYSKKYKAYVLLVLTGVYTFNFIDRQILVILQESIKAELGLSDTQLGLLTGLTFAFFYVTLGIPIARWADKSNRRNIVALSLAIWSAMTALSGFVTSYVQLLLARIGVGIGEAGGSPPAHSMISDYFPPDKRATALSIYSTGIYIGILFGYIGGGWIDQYFGWRMAFLILGLPGIAYAILLLLTVKEPPKGHSDPAVEESEIVPFRRVVKELFSKKTFLFLSLASGLHTFATYGVGNFFAPFLARVHQMEVGMIGTWLGITSGLGGILGTFLGGYLADRMGQKNVKWYLLIPAFAEIINFPVAVVAFFSSQVSIVLIAYFLTSLLTAVYLGPCLAVTHNLLDAKKRALASAIFFLILNFIGLGFGPLTIGYLSDLFSAEFAERSLRVAFCSTFITGTAALVFFVVASRYFTQELKVDIGSAENGA